MKSERGGWDEAPQAKAWAIGIGFAMPFVRDWIGIVLATVVLGGAVLLIFADMVRGRGSRSQRVPNSVAFWLVGFVVVTHAIALGLSYTPYAEGIVRELVSSVLMLALALVVVGSGTSVRVIERGIVCYFVIVMWGAVLVASAGLVKGALLERGYLVEVLLDHFGESYPSGTSLRSDYNVYSMLLLVGAVGAAFVGALKNTAAVSVVVALLLGVGLVSGSRRFMLAAVFVPLGWLYMEFLSAGVRANSAKLVAVVLSVAAAWWLSVGISSPTQFERYRSGSEPWRVVDVMYLSGLRHRLASVLASAEKEVLASAEKEVLASAEKEGVHGGRSSLAQTGGPVIKAPYRTYGEVLLATMGAGEDFGLSSRIQRYRFGLELGRRAPMLGAGFGYHEKFSCEFVECAYIDYPHSPVMSEWLISGVVGLVSIVVLLAVLVWTAVVASGSLYGFALGLALLCMAPFFLLSGDNMLSLLHFVSTGLLLTIYRGYVSSYAARLGNGACGHAR